MKTICVYCGSSDAVPAAHFTAAQTLGEEIAARKWTLVYGAGATGLMGTLANGALARGGRVVGVLPEFFQQPGVYHPNLSRLEITQTMHQRKARMAQLADAFIALPGGYGTLDEFFEIVTWKQINLHHKPIGLLNLNGYYDALLQFTHTARTQGFLREDLHKPYFVTATTPTQLLNQLF